MFKYGRDTVIVCGPNEESRLSTMFPEVDHTVVIVGDYDLKPGPGYDQLVLTRAAEHLIANEPGINQWFRTEVLTAMKPGAIARAHELGEGKFGPANLDAVRQIRDERLRRGP